MTSGPGEEVLARLLRRFPDGFMLAESVTVTANGDDQLLVFGEKGFRLDGADAHARLWVQAVIAGVGWDRLPEAKLTRPALALLLEFETRGMLVGRSLSDVQDQYTKQRRWLAHNDEQPAAAMERIATHHAVILGCGGVGSIVATHLGAMGIGHLLLIDHDAVEVTNFNRQFAYRRSDLGRPKVEALKDFLADRYPDTRVDTAEVFVDSADTLASYLPADIDPRSCTVFCCADRPVGTSAAVVAEVAATFGASALFAAAGLEEAAVGPLLTGGPTPAYAAYAAEMANVGAVARTALADPIMGASIAPVNTIAAAWMAYEWLDGVILDRSAGSVNSRFVVDIRRSRIYEEREWR